MLYCQDPNSLPPSSPKSKKHAQSILGSIQSLPPPTTELLFQLLTSAPARSHLHTLLMNRNLTLFRDGFPFRYTLGYDSTTAESRYYVSYDPYEIDEVIIVPTEAGASAHARFLMTLSYTRGKPHTTLEKFFSWTIYLSTADPRISRTSPLRNLSSQRASIAQVFVDPSILNPSSNIKFGQLITQNPAVISHALSLSLERGMAITILPSLPSTRTPYAPPYDLFGIREGGDAQPGVLYVGTTNQGEQKVLLNIGSTSSMRDVDLAARVFKPMNS